MGLTKIGLCKDAFEFDGRGTILAFNLYVNPGTFKHSELVPVKVVKDGKELGQFEAEICITLGGKRHRYDMDRVELMLKSDVGLKDKVVDSNIYILKDIDFWVPADT